jgi:hypothetical protein
MGIAIFNLFNKVMAAQRLSPGDMRRFLGTYKPTLRGFLDAG